MVSRDFVSSFVWQMCLMLLILMFATTTEDRRNISIHRQAEAQTPCTCRQTSCLWSHMPLRRTPAAVPCCAGTRLIHALPMLHVDFGNRPLASIPCRSIHASAVLVPFLMQAF